MSHKFNQIRIHGLVLVFISGLLFSCGSVRSVATQDPVQVIIREARTFIGVPYQWGGLTRQGLDCSGLVQLSFRKAGIPVPRTTEGLQEVGKRVKLKKARPGDLLFFALSEKRNKVTHVGIVTQKERGKCPAFIHASTSKGVMEGSMELKYYQKGFKEAGYNVEIVPNQGRGAAKQRVEATRRRFPMIWFDAETTEAGRAALGWYHEKIDEIRGIGLGPEHDWSSHSADAFGLMCSAYQEPNKDSEEWTKPIAINTKYIV